MISLTQENANKMMQEIKKMLSEADPVTIGAVYYTLLFNRNRGSDTQGYEKKSQAK